MNAPERIWAKRTGEFLAGIEFGHWGGAAGALDAAEEYIRADLVQSLIKAARDLDRQFCDDDLGPSALAMGKLREAYMRLK